MVIEKHMKYGDDELIESQTDAYIFHKIGLGLVDVSYALGLTPNMITFLSMMSGFYAIYLLCLGRTKEAGIFYIIGYILDCVDGRLARTHNMGSKFGEMFDLVSDMLVNSVLVSMFIYKYHNTISFEVGLLFIIATLGTTVWFGLVEAQASMKKFGTDKYLEEKKKLFKDYPVLSNIYVNTISSSYYLYKLLVPLYDDKKVTKLITQTKIFGAGNVNTLIFAILWNTV